MASIWAKMHMHLHGILELPLNYSNIHGVENLSFLTFLVFNKNMIASVVTVWISKKSYQILCFKPFLLFSEKSDQEVTVSICNALMG